MKIGILTDHQNSTLIDDDKELISSFGQKGINAFPLVWNKKQNWKQYDAILIRTTWDYSEHLDEFKSTLETIEQETTLIHNKDLVFNNISKEYLSNLEYTKEIVQVPTIRSQGLSKNDIHEAFSKFGCDQLVLKPTVGAGGKLNLLISKDDFEKSKELYYHDILIQPFLPSIQTRGEFSFIFFNEQYSHSVLKKVNEGEFRVQENFGGTVKAFRPNKKIIKACEDFLALQKLETTYARVDIAMEGDILYLMELELIEPELFFRFSDEGINLFTEAVTSKLKGSL